VLPSDLSLLVSSFFSILLSILLPYYFSRNVLASAAREIPFSEKVELRHYPSLSTSPLEVPQRGIGDRHGHLPEGFRLAQFVQPRVALVSCDCTIENRSHYVRDVSFGEERSRLRSGHAPQILAALRNLAITLLHRSGSSEISSARRSFASYPERALALLCSKGGQQ